MASKGKEDKSFNSMFEALSNWLSNNGSVQMTSEAFSEMISDQARAVFVLTQPEVDKFIDPIIGEKHKSLKYAEQLREKGNEFFKIRDYETSINCYTKSIQWAPPSKNDETKSLALAFANRSASLFYMKSYDECILDIDYALENDYPSALRYKLYERKGRSYAFLGKLEQAQKTFALAVASLEDIKMDKSKKKALEKSFDNSLDNCRKKTYSSKPQSKELGKGFNFATPVFSTPTNEVFPSLSAAVEVAYSTEKGRHVIAKEYLAPGSIVLIEKPYASVLLPTQYNTHCHHCMKRTNTPVPCVSCVLIAFCSKKCRGQAMETYHRYECKCLPTLKESGLDKFSFLALRTVAKQPLRDVLAYKEKLETMAGMSGGDDPIRVGCDDEGKYRCDNYHAVHTLVTHAADRKGHDLYRRAVIAAYLVKCLQRAGYFSSKKSKDKLATKENLAFVGGLILSHLQLMPCNAHEVSELVLDPTNVGTSTTMEIGAGIYSTLSLFNHSCNPAVTRNFHAGPCCAVRTIRAVHAGEELTDNYGAVYEVADREQRRNDMLAPQYFFQCQCKACEQDWPQFDALQSIDTQLRCTKCLRPLENHPAKKKICQRKFSQKDIAERMEGLKVAEAKFGEAFQYLMHCNWQKALPEFLKYLEVIDGLVPPYKGTSSCQEALKQCYNIMGNCHLKLDQE